VENFEYINPVKIIFGNGGRKKIGEIIKIRYSKVLLVCSKGPFRENGHFDFIKKKIEDAGAETFEMEDIDSNPRLSSVRKGAEICKKNGIECVVALGGGSTMDCAKVISGAALTDTDPRDFLFGDKVHIEKALDTIMIPTIASTGTELNNTAVIMDGETTEKSWCFSDSLFPKVTIMDPELTVSVPKNLTVWAAMDILSHTFEFYFNGYSGSLFQTNFSEAIIRSAMECLDVLVRKPEDLQARGELMWTSVITWGGLTKIGRGGPDMACHGSMPGLVSYFDMHHGGALGVFTPRWMLHIYKEAPGIFARFARKIFNCTDKADLAAAESGIRQYISWIKKSGCPDTFADLGADKPDDTTLRQIAEKMARENGGTLGALVELHADDIFNLYQQCWQPLSISTEV
jgi:alcohol dehydrogenase